MNFSKILFKSSLAIPSPLSAIVIKTFSESAKVVEITTLISLSLGIEYLHALSIKFVKICWNFSSSSFTVGKCLFKFNTILCSLNFSQNFEISCVGVT